MLRAQLDRARRTAGARPAASFRSPGTAGAIGGPPDAANKVVPQRGWQISLAVAANVLHLLPTGTHDHAALAEELIATIDATATGSLHRCHLALQSDGESRGYDTDEWLPLVYEQAADWLTHASPTAEPPPAIEHAQQAGRFAALAIGSLDRDAPTVPEAITDCLAHLLFTCVFADAAACSRHGG